MNYFDNTYSTNLGATNVKYKQRVGEDLFLELTLKWSGEAADLTNAVNTKLHIEQIGCPWNKYHGFTITGNVVSMQLTAEENTHCGIFNATFSADIPNANSSTGYVTRKWDFRYLYMIVATSDEEALSDTVESTGEIAKYGSDGLSAYDIAVKNGYVGTTAAYLASLKGDKGDKGDTGAQGAKGDAFLYSDFTTEQLAALKGEKGDQGDPGTNGTNGTDGKTPALSVGTVSKGEAASATVS